MEKEVPITYVTGIATYGFLNGIINVAFTTARWLPREVEEEVKIVPYLAITADLRLDLNVAQELYKALGDLIEANTKPKVTN
jgi:hypothetical protein